MKITLFIEVSKNFQKLNNHESHQTKIYFDLSHQENSNCRIKVDDS